LGLGGQGDGQATKTVADQRHPGVPGHRDELAGDGLGVVGEMDAAYR
jgi:hypothetical protein